LNRVTNCANVAMSPSSQPVSRSARRSRTACAAAFRCRDQLLELPGQGGLVQAEVRAQVGRAYPGREVDLGQQRVGDGPGASVVIVVGRSEHGYHVLGSVPQALGRHAHYPVMVVA
jgi:hypothetical protein